MERTPYKWTLIVNLTVSPSWVADGFDASERTDEIAGILRDVWLPYAFEHELTATVRVTKAPDPSAIRKEQGYED